VKIFLKIVIQCSFLIDIYKWNFNNMKMMMNTNFDDSRSFMDWNQLSKFDEDKKDDIEGEYLNTKSEFMMNLSMPMKFLLH